MRAHLRRRHAIPSLPMPATLPALQAPGRAGPSPGTPATILVGCPSGGPLDAQVRLRAEERGQPVVIDVKSVAGAGACGTPGAQAVALVVNPPVPAKTVAELVALATSRPCGLVDGPAGNGGNGHLVPEGFKTATGTVIAPIPYQGSAPAVTGPMAGQVPLADEPVPQAAQSLKAGKLRSLAVTSARRNPALPDTPTMVDAGIQGFEVVGPDGVPAPAGTPRPVLDRLSAAFKAVLDDLAIRNRRVVRQGDEPTIPGHAEFTRCVAAGTPRWALAMKDSGVKPE